MRMGEIHAGGAQRPLPTVRGLSRGTGEETTRGLAMLKPNPRNDFNWRTQPDAAHYVQSCVERLCARSQDISRWNRLLPSETGTRLINWVDQLVVPRHPTADKELLLAGFEYVREDGVDDVSSWLHPDAVLPVVRMVSERGSNGDPPYQLFLKVDSVDHFLKTHRLDSTTPVEGLAGGRCRQACVGTSEQAELWVVERHGWCQYHIPEDTPEQIRQAAGHVDALRGRQRLAGPAGFDRAGELIAHAIKDLGQDWACALFFRAEREYWQSRNQAARAQYARQQRVGMGWANHDHHTYRCSRDHIHDVVNLLEELGFYCRERFYADEQAGWGAQVLEQPVVGITVFADVDLSPDEVQDDFAHSPLPPRAHLGTVGLWCGLHGEAFLEAGMHHLECQFSFNAAREQLAKQGVRSMDPFTNSDNLKQSFTEGERWPVDAHRIDRLLSAGFIDDSQADSFRREGAIGSHLEILQREDGFKGFNQTGISDIIQRTNPRKH